MFGSPRWECKILKIFRIARFIQGGAYVPGIEYCPAAFVVQRDQIECFVNPFRCEIKYGFIIFKTRPSDMSPEIIGRKILCLYAF